MKNILAFVNSAKKFDGESSLLIKIQIDNSLDLGWKKEDIILATNFDFEYNGVRAIVVSDDNFLPYSSKGSKNKAVLELFDRGVLSGNELYWFHDLDAYQSEIITEPELNMGGADIASSDYCWREKLSTGSIFFNAGAKDIYRGFIEIHNIIQADNDEEAFIILIDGLTQAKSDELTQKYGPKILEKIPPIRDIKKRFLKINTTYNFAPYRNAKFCYEMAIKPIRVVHFHTNWRNTFFAPNILDFFMYGVNEANAAFMSKRLIKIFHHHGVK